MGRRSAKPPSAKPPTTILWATTTTLTTATKPLSFVVECVCLVCVWSVLLFCCSVSVCRLCFCRVCCVRVTCVLLQIRLNMNRIPYSFPRSAYSTCRVALNPAPSPSSTSHFHLMRICFPPPGPPPPPNTAADTAHNARSTQPALRPHRATPRIEDKPPQTRRPHSTGLCLLLSEGPDPGSAQRHVHAGSPVHTAPIKQKKNEKRKKDPRISSFQG